MRFQTPRQRRRRRALEAPFPDDWRRIIEGSVAHWAWLDASERVRLEELIKVFLLDTRFEWVDGLEESDEVKLVVAVSACLLILGIDRAHFRDVKLVIMHPTSTAIAGERGASEDRSIVTDEIVPILGLAVHRGPILIAWDSAKRSAMNPATGHNVIYHEFAHKIDMADGTVDGIPPMAPADRERWEMVCRAEYEVLESEVNPEPLLSDYGAVSPVEFFAVATEVFFNRPLEMQERKPSLYAVMQEFYRQDTADRERRFRRDPTP